MASFDSAHFQQYLREYIENNFHGLLGIDPTQFILKYVQTMLPHVKPSSRIKPASATGNRADNYPEGAFDAIAFDYELQRKYSKVNDFLLREQKITISALMYAIKAIAEFKQGYWNDRSSKNRILLEILETSNLIKVWDRIQLTVKLLDESKGPHVMLENEKGEELAAMWKIKYIGTDIRKKRNNPGATICHVMIETKYRLPDNGTISTKRFSLRGVHLEGENPYRGHDKNVHLSLVDLFDNYVWS